MPFRDFTTTYGFTRINGNTITTGKIITSDKECYLDLDGNKFRIGDSSSSIDWNVTAKRQLTLHNVRLLSDSGDTSHIGVFRGTYNPKYVYYAGDEVTYTVNGETCTYRYTNPTPSMGNLPTNSVYWSVVAKGSTGDKGESGLSVFYTYNDSETKPATPTGDGSTGGWHRTSSENVVWMSIKNAKTDTEGAWGIPFRVRGADGTSINIKGSKDNVSQLPTVGNSEGDAYLIGGNLYIWDGTNWKDVGAIKGEDGKSSYLHKKYSDDGGKTFTAGNGETPGRWLGLYVDMIPTDSDKPSAYKWSDTKGQDGTPGLPGEDGRTPYFHIKYSDNGGMSFTANNGEEPGDYIGQYTDYVQKDSDNPMDYTWALIKGESGTGGTDAGAGEYYEYRYAKNGSTSTPPTLDINSSNPAGWTTEMPTLDEFEYLWCIMAKKSGLADRTKFYLPIEENNFSDVSGNGYNGVLGSGTVVKDGTRYALNLSGGMESRIPYDLPFGESFTLCFWMKSEQRQIKWMLNGYNGRHYVEKSIAITPNTWFHLAFRFNDRTVTVFKNGEQLHSGSVNIMAVGFAIYDDDVFGSAVYFDDVRLLMGALPVNDIASVMNGKADTMVQKWSTPVRINSYNGDKGEPGTSVTLADVEYAQSTSNTVAPTTGWQTTAPTWIDGRYIWSRTKVSYSDNTTTYTKAVCITGGKGTTGVGVSSIVEQYYLSSSATSLLGGSWGTTRPTWKDKWYIWTRSVITYTNGTSDTTAAICVTGSKGDKGEPGDKGEKGDSPAAVYQGLYSSSKTYYGNKYRLDVVKYNNVFYVARIDAGTFSGVVPTNTSKWNTFGAQFESVATNLLLAENANIAGWVFRNGRLESQNGNVYMDGNKGEVRLKGTLQLSTGFSGNFSDVNLFYLPETTSERNITMGYEKEDIGKVCRLYNSGAFGKANYHVEMNTFSITDNVTSSSSSLYALIRPQEIVEMTCFERKGSTPSKILGEWTITSRFSRDDFITNGATGRFARIMAMGTFYGSSGASVSGKFFDGRNLREVFTASRQDTGRYRLSFANGTLPSGYMVMVCGNGTISGGSNPLKANVYVQYSTYFEVMTSDDSSRNDGNFNFVVFAPDWDYKY